MSGSSVKLSVPGTIPSLSKPLSTRCASTRLYAVAQIVPNDLASATTHYRLKVLFRSNSPQNVATYIRRNPGWHYVYDLTEGDLIWENTSSEWFSAERAVAARHASRRRR